MHPRSMNGSANPTAVSKMEAGQELTVNNLKSIYIGMYI
jgi:hypothetical protein